MNARSFRSFRSLRSLHSLHSLRTMYTVHAPRLPSPPKVYRRVRNYFFLGAALAISSTLSPGGSDCLSFSAFSVSWRTRV